jgi:hypothetical protein
VVIHFPKLTVACHRLIRGKVGGKEVSLESIQIITTTTTTTTTHYIPYYIHLLINRASIDEMQSMQQLQP